MPVSDEARRTVLSLNLGEIDFSLVLSMSENNSYQSQISQQNSIAKSMAGIFVVLKLTVGSIDAIIHKQKYDLTPLSNNTNHLIHVLKSDESSRFLNGCVMVDIPSTRELDIGIDIQVSLSPLNISINKDSIAGLIDPNVKIQMMHWITCMKDIYVLTTLMIDSRIMIDCIHHLPTVLLRHNWGNNSVSNSAINPQDLKQDTKANHEVFIPTFVRPSEAQIQDQKIIVSSYLNTRLWHNILSYILPKGNLTLCFHTSTITIDALSAVTLRQFILILQKDVYGKALVGPSFSSNHQSEILLSYMKNIIRNYGKDKRQTNLQRKMALSKQANIKIEPVLLEFSKAVSPFPSVSIRVLGINISIPIDDDTLSRALALVFASLFPLYISSSSSSVAATNDNMTTINRNIRDPNTDRKLSHSTCNDTDSNTNTTTIDINDISIDSSDKQRSITRKSNTEDVLQDSSVADGSKNLSQTSVSEINSIPKSAKCK
jgi:hypothetical protein